MPIFSNLTHRTLKIIFAFHLILVSWAIQELWCPKSVILYNALFFISIMWAIHNTESDEPIQFALFINVTAIFLDMIVLIVFFRASGHISEKFSAACMSINLVGRAVSSIYLLRIGQERNGSLSSMIAPNPAMGFGRREYEDISHPVPQATDFDRI